MATTAIPANCAAVEQQLLVETGRLQEPMFNRMALKRPIIDLMANNRTAWQNGRGYSVSAVTFERSFPNLATDGWANIAASDGDAANACLPPVEEVTFGQTTRSYTPQHYSVNTQEWCIKDIQAGWQFAEFLTNVNQALETISEWVWYQWYMRRYFALSGHHLTLNQTAGIQDHASAYNTSNPPTSPLTQGVLDHIYMELVREGGAEAADVDTGEAVFTLVTSSEQSKSVLRSDSAMREDIRYATMGMGNNAPLVPGMPTKRRQFGGFIHRIDPYPRRFRLTGGAYEEVPPFIQSEATKGDKWEVNPAWKVAPYEEFLVYHKNVFQPQIVNTVTNPAPGWNFDARTWSGEFSPRNILHKTCNPDGQILFLRALFAAAAKPIDPNVGWIGIAARCGVDLNLQEGCYGS